MSDEEDYNDDDEEEEEEEEEEEGEGEGEEEAKRLEKEESVRKDLERLRVVFGYIDRTSRRIQHTLDINDKLTAQSVEIEELKRIIETQNKSLIDKTSGNLDNTNNSNKNDNLAASKDIDTGSKLGLSGRAGSPQNRQRGRRPATTISDSEFNRSRRGVKYGDGDYDSNNDYESGEASESDNKELSISWSQYEKFNDAERAGLLERAIEALTKSGAKEKRGARGPDVGRDRDRDRDSSVGSIRPSQPLKGGRHTKISPEK